MEAFTDYAEEKPSLSVLEALPRRTTAEEAAALGRERCPRCQSTDTKFCYFNNYNTAQPRHFCKSCRRYWTLGGTLRNVPIGGSTRKRLRRAPTQPTLSLPATVSPAAGSLSARARFMEEMGFGMGPGLLWPTSFVNGYMWGVNSGGEDCKSPPPPPAAASGW